VDRVEPRLEQVTPGEEQGREGKGRSVHGDLAPDPTREEAHDQQECQAQGQVRDAVDHVGQVRRSDPLSEQLVRRANRVASHEAGQRGRYQEPAERSRRPGSENGHEGRADCRDADEAEEERLSPAVPGQEEIAAGRGTHAQVELSGSSHAL
jgi:hypothetical protein